MKTILKLIQIKLNCRQSDWTPMDDFLSTGDGADPLSGGNGNEELNGGIGNDFHSGGQNNDILHGEQENSRINIIRREIL